MADPKLAAMLGTDAARLVHDALPRIEKQLFNGAKTASVDVRFTFLSRKGELAVELAAKERISAPVHQRKLKTGPGGQLMLFED